MSFEIHPWKIVLNGYEKAQLSRLKRLTAMGNGYMGLCGSFEEDREGVFDSWFGGIEIPDLNAPKPVRALRMHGIGVWIDGEELDLSKADVKNFTCELDLKNGILLRKFVIQTEKGRIAFRVERFVSAAQKELLAVKYSILPEYDVHIALKPSLDGNASDELWEGIAEEENEDGAALLMRIGANAMGVAPVAVGAAMCCWSDGLEPEGRRLEKGFAEAAYEGTVEAGDMAVLEKYVLCFTSREYEVNALTTVALRAAARARELGFDEMRDAQKGAWKARWAACDIAINGDDEAQQQIRYAMFRLWNVFSGEETAALGRDDRTAAAPFYMAEMEQDLVRPLLTDVGGDACQHAALAHLMFDYATYTGDFEWIRKDGLTVLCAIARFFHQKAMAEQLEQDWYIRRMASWSIGLFLTQAHRAAPERVAALDLSKTEMAQMLELVQKLYPVENEQDELEKADAGDVLQGLYKLNHLYDEGTIRRCFERCATEPASSSEAGVRCVLAARTGAAEKMSELFHTVLRNAHTPSGWAACWIAAVRGLAGMITAEDLSFRPVLPADWKGYSLRVRYRGRLIHVSVSAGTVRVELLEGQPLGVRLFDEEIWLKDQAEQAF